MTDFLSFHLSDSFIEPYQDKPVDWGFPIGGGNSLSELTFVLKYSRKKEDGTKEQWWEVCRRCVEGMYSILKDHAKHYGTTWNEFKAQKSAQDAFDRMFHFKWTPPGRGMQHMGTRNIIEQRNMARLVNCLAGETEVVTRNGIFPIKELAGGTHTLLTTSGWVNAPVLSFGSQELYEIEMTKSGVSKTIRATADHRWFVKDRRNTSQKNKFREVLTRDLVGGVHQFKSITANAIKLTHLSPVGVAAGFFVGDSSLTEIDSYSNRVRLCGDKKQDLMPFFAAHRTQPITGSDDVFVLDCPNYFKDVPSLTETASYLFGWVAGLFAADGNVSNKGACIASANREFLERVKSICSIIGIGVGPIQKNSYVSNLTNREATSYKLPVDRKTLTRDFFIRRSHRDIFDQYLTKKTSKVKRSENRWYVKSVTATGVLEEVYCAVVDGVGNFALADGLLTGNCAALGSEKISTHSAYRATMPFVRFMEMSMNGVGVGVNTAGAGKITLHQPNDEVDVVVVPDTREGWAASLGVLLESFFFKDRNTVQFDYSEIRPEGTELHSFGGVASGHRPLKKMHERISERLSGREGELLTSRDIADIVNLAGKACTAGGTRRSATILFGEKDDEDYVNLKNWNLPENDYRTGTDGFAWASNNSVVVNVSDDLDDLIDLVAVNGEPGFLWVDMIQKYGRLADVPDYKDYRATLSNPCGEIALEGQGELCNLSEVYPTNHETYEDFIGTLKHAYMYTKVVTLLTTPWPETNEVNLRNRRIGISMTGLALFVETRGWSLLSEWQDGGYKELRRLDQKYSEWLGVRESIRLTTVKPAGSTSLVTSVTPGVHWPTTSNYHLRRIRFLHTDPLVNILEKAGYHVEPDQGDPDSTVVVTFPTEGVNIRSEREVSVWEKAALAVSCQRYWSDNMVSCTLSFLPHEVKELSPLLSSYRGQMKSASFLPIDESGTTYAQAPYEPVSEEDALKWMAEIKPISKTELYGDSISDFIEDKFCTTDSCEIPQR